MTAAPIISFSACGAPSAERRMTEASARNKVAHGLPAASRSYATRCKHEAPHSGNALNVAQYSELLAGLYSAVTESSMPYLHVNGINLYYEWHGPEMGDVVILNNGIFMSAASWAFQVVDLRKRYRVLAWDMRGQGQSEHPDMEYTMALHADDLAALMDALDIEHAHMVGTSYGGSISLIMGLRHPARTRSAMAICSIAKSDALSAAMFERWRLAALLGDGELFFRLVHADVYSERFLAERTDLVPAALQRYATLDLKAAVRLLECFQRYDISAELPMLKTPTCVVAAEREILKIRAHVEEIHRAVPGSEFHLIPNAGHVAVLERAAEVNTLILGWLAKQAS
ncbi:MAG: alpha/beta fold hydrolase [Thermoflexales bacterium]